MHANKWKMQQNCVPPFVDIIFHLTNGCHTNCVTGSLISYLCENSFGSLFMYKCNSKHIKLNASKPCSNKNNFLISTYDAKWKKKKTRNTRTGHQSTGLSSEKGWPEMKIISYKIKNQEQIQIHMIMHMLKYTKSRQ